MRIAVAAPCRPASTLLKTHISRSDASSSSTPVASAAEEQLLRALRQITTSQRGTSIDTHISVAANGAVEELAWSRTRVAVSVGGTVVRQWDLGGEDEEVQFACHGHLEYILHASPPTNAASDAANVTAHGSAESVSALDARTFGPFSRMARLDAARSSSKTSTGSESVNVRALFIFLRTTARIFLDNGIDYVVNLPFIVSRAWPMFPRGVIIERAASFRHPDGPRLFALTDALGEILPVGKADTLSRNALPGHRDLNTMLPPQERVLDVIPREPPLPCPIAVTIHGRARLTFWRVEGSYRSSKPPPDAPVQPPRHPTNHARRSSTESNSQPRQPFSAATITSLTQPVSTMSPRTDLSMAMDRMELATRAERDVFNISASQVDMEGGALLGKLYSCELPEGSWNEHDATAFIVDTQHHAWGFYCRIAVHFPSAATLVSIELQQHRDGRIAFSEPYFTPARSAIAVAGIRPLARDIIILKPDYSLAALVYGMRELPLALPTLDPGPRLGDGMDVGDGDGTKVIALREAAGNGFTAMFESGREVRVTLQSEPADRLARDCFAVLAFALTQEAAFELYAVYLRECAASDAPDDFEALRRAILVFVGDEERRIVPEGTPWEALGHCLGFRDDVALAGLSLPPVRFVTRPLPTADNERRTQHLAPMLYALHLLGEDYRLSVKKTSDLLRLAPLLIRLSRGTRPLWADHWSRLSPSSPDAFLDALTPGILDALPHNPPSILVHLRCRLLQEKCASWPTLAQIPALFAFEASLEYGSAHDPVQRSQEMLALYRLLTNGGVTERSERAVMALLARGWTRATVDELPVGAATPIREALRRCQQSPPSDWPVAAYTLIGRDDLARMATYVPSTAGETPVAVAGKSRKRRRVQQIVDEMRAGISTDVRHASGVDLNIGGFTDVRFGQDLRLQEVARILQSSSIPAVAIPNVADISEHDLAREHQNLVLRVCERTLALPLGRALFTFGTVSTVLRDAYAIPKMEYDVRVQPDNIVITAEAGKISPESRAWAEFHNGVAAGLRIAPDTEAVDSEWIVSNKPSDLSPQHAGFLFALGLTGHLKKLFTWHMFQYLTPKHDLTSIGILLGASTGYLGTGHQNMMSLIAVHTPALLPVPRVDLNIPLITQAAGLASAGLVLMGTRDRHTAEVALTEIGHSRTITAETVHENREAYSLSAALAFGMIMLGTRAESLSAADRKFVDVLRMYIHGVPPSTDRAERPPFDLNITAPVATIALALMFLKSERHEIADIVALPTTSQGLDQIPPNLLLLRTLAKAIILWGDIHHGRDWVHSQVPQDILQSVGKPFSGLKDSLELAYYHMVAGACFALGLKYAGSALPEAKVTLLGFFDKFSRQAGETGGGFEQKIKRAAIQDGLSLIAVSLGLVMAGTGDIPCLRRFRMMHGQTSARYGAHAAVHMSIGLLFLGGGKFTLGTSNCAIACLVTAFFPRFPRSSSDNVSYVQALRHLWVLALEPRCLVSRDVDTNEFVHLPLKIRTSEAGPETVSEVVSPALIPDFDKIQTITVESDQYWPVILDLANNKHHRNALVRAQTIFVKRKTGFLAYDAEATGSRGIVLRPGASNADVISTAYVTELKWTQHELQSFVQSLKSDNHLSAFIDMICRRSASHPEDRAFHLFATGVLIESLTLDKLHMLHHHLLLYNSLHRPLPPRPHSNVITDLSLATTFYHHRFFPGDLQAGATALITTSTLANIQHALRVAMAELRKTEVFTSMTERYMRGENLREGMSDTTEVGWRILAAYLVAQNLPPPGVLAELRALTNNAQQHEADNVIRLLAHMASARLEDHEKPTWRHASLSDIFASWTSAS